MVSNTNTPIPSSNPETPVPSQNVMDLAVSQIMNQSIDQAKCYAIPQEVSVVDQGNAITPRYAKALLFGNAFGLTKYNGTIDYRPGSYMTRQEAARLFSQFAQNVLCRKEHLTYTNQFSDLDLADPTLQKYIQQSYEFGIFK